MRHSTAQAEPVAIDFFKVRVHRRPVGRHDLFEEHLVGPLGKEGVEAEYLIVAEAAAGGVVG